METTELELVPEPAPYRETDPGSALANIASIEDIDAQLRRAEKMGEALDKIRSMAVKRTVPSDWILMGQTLYLEGDGALRIAPMIGLRLLNVRKNVNVVDGGVVRVTIRADASSTLFGTRFDGLEKTRASDDAFLTQNGRKERADLEDVEASAYKGLIARATQLLCGLSGLTPDEARDRFARYLAIGCTSLLFWHVAINIAMVIGMAPVVGVTLLLVSYGGSSLLIVMLTLGLLMNVSIRRYSY
jgi:hypothetical protein